LTIFLATLAISGAARAEPVNPPPTPPSGAVAAEQHPIQVGDVIMAPAIETDSDEANGIRRPGQERSVEPGARRRWYGLPMLVTDGAAYLLLATAVANENSQHVTLPLSLPTFVLSGPITHAANAHWGRAGISLLMRVGLPLTGAMIGADGCGRGGHDCSTDLISSAIGGMVIASLIDVAALSWESAEPTRASSLQPGVAVTNEGALIGASGRF